MMQDQRGIHVTFHPDKPGQVKFMSLHANDDDASREWLYSLYRVISREFALRALGPDMVESMGGGKGSVLDSPSGEAT